MLITTSFSDHWRMLAVVPLADLSLRHLAALQAVVAHGSFRRAAGALGYSQAAITQQIATLERAVGIPVFERPGGPRPVTLTAAGREVLVAAQDVLARVGSLESRVSGLLAGTTGRLAIGTFQSVSAQLLPQLLAEIRASEPDISVSVLESDDNGELVDGLLNGSLDVSFLVGPVADDRLRIVEVCRDPFVAMSAAGDDDSPVIGLDALADRPVIGHRSCVCHEPFEEGLRAAGIIPDFVFRSNDNAAVQAMVRADVGTAVMPLLAIDPGDPRVRIQRLEPPMFERSILVAVPRDRVEKPAEQFVCRALTLGATLTETRADAVR